MKNVLTFWGLFAAASMPLLAQTRFAIAPTVGGMIGQDEYQLQQYSTDILHYSATNKGFSVDLTGHYYMSPKVDISIGLALDVLTFNQQRQYKQPYQQTIGVKSTTGYARLPVLINYRLSTKRLSPYISLGASFSNYNRLNITDAIQTSALVGIGVDYKLGAKLSLLIQPTGSYSLEKAPKDATTTFAANYSFLLGLQTQLIWRL